MEFEIKQIVTHADESFSVTFETAYFEKTIRFEKNMKFLDIETNKPMFLHRIKEFIERKLLSVAPAQVSSEFSQYCCKYKSEDIEDKSVKALNQKCRDKRNEKIEMLKKIEDELKSEELLAESIQLKRNQLDALRHKNKEMAKQDKELNPDKK